MRSMCTAAAEVASAQRVGRWSLRLAHDNTFLSYHRNAIIATVAGASLIQYRQNQDRPPLAGTALLTMGGLYMYVGSGLYVWQVYKLRKPLKLGKWTIFWALFNASWPLALWSVALLCLLDETPTPLLELLRLVEDRLPSALHSSLFLDPPALYPVCVLLRAVSAHEEVRLESIRNVASSQPAASAARRRSAEANMDAWTATRRVFGRLTNETERPGPLSHSDVATIIAKRLERLALLQEAFDDLARSSHAVPTAVAAPLLDTLNTEAMLLEKVLEIDTSQGEQSFVLWRLSTFFSAEHRRLRDEVQRTHRSVGTPPSTLPERRTGL